MVEESQNNQVCIQIETNINQMLLNLQQPICETAGGANSPVRGYSTIVEEQGAARHIERLLVERCEFN